MEDGCGRSVPGGRLSFVYNRNSDEEIPQEFLLMLQRAEVFCQGSLLKVMADHTNLIKPISSAVTFHAMAQKTDGGQVALLETSFNRGEVALTISEKSRHDRFQVRINCDDNSLSVGIRARLCH